VFKEDACATRLSAIRASNRVLVRRSAWNALQMNMELIPVHVRAAVSTRIVRLDTFAILRVAETRVSVVANRKSV